MTRAPRVVDSAAGRCVRSAGGIAATIDAAGHAARAAIEDRGRIANQDREVQATRVFGIAGVARHEALGRRRAQLEGTVGSRHVRARTRLAVYGHGYWDGAANLAAGTVSRAGARRGDVASGVRGIRGGVLNEEGATKNGLAGPSPALAGAIRAAWVRGRTVALALKRGRAGAAVLREGFRTGFGTTGGDLARLARAARADDGQHHDRAPRPRHDQTVAPAGERGCGPEVLARRTTR